MIMPAVVVLLLVGTGCVGSVSFCNVPVMTDALLFKL
jgi:hypothetical protein